MVALFPMELVKEVRTEVAAWWSVALETAAGLHGVDGVFRGAGRWTQGSYDVTSPTPPDTPQDTALSVSE